MSARPERATRGRRGQSAIKAFHAWQGLTLKNKRLSKLLDEEAEADEEFWNQDAFQEDDGDTDFEALGDASDDFDSDFDDEEPSSDDGEGEEDERAFTKKRKILPGRMPTTAQKKAKKKGTMMFDISSFGRVTEAPVAAPKPPRPPRPKQPPPEILESSMEVTVDIDGEKTTVRKSTRKAVIVKQAMREAQRVAMEAMAKPVKKKEVNKERKITQEEMLLEAAKTEVLNRKALEAMLAREEEVKKKAVIQKAIYSGPQIRFHSKNGTNTIEFTHTDEFPELINSKVGAYPHRSVCAITGLPAKYRDPQTGLPYATKEAFQMIRERYSRGEKPSRNEEFHQHQRKRTKVEREYTIPGKAGVTKVKYKRSTSACGPAEAALPSIAAGMSPTSDGETRARVPVENSLPSTPSVVPPESSAEALRVDATAPSLREGNSGTGTDKRIIQQPPPPQPLPRAMFEANEADFMLEDLEVSLPSNLDTGLSSLSLSESGISSAMMHSQGMLREHQSHMHLQHEILDLPQPGQELMQPELLSMDVFGSLM